MVCRAAGVDRFLTLVPPLDLKASPGQWFEIRLKADRDGVAQLFWSNNGNGPYGGLSEEESTRFNVRGDRAWHTYRFLPFWQNEGRIARLRFDLYDATQFEIGTLRAAAWHGNVLALGLRASDEDNAVATLHWL